MEYKRVILKLSGDFLNKEWQAGIDLLEVEKAAREIISVSKQVEMGIVIGAGNIWRGRHDTKRIIDSQTADYMGIMATFVNALALKGVLARHKIKAHIVAPFFMFYSGETSLSLENFSLIGGKQTGALLRKKFSKDSFLPFLPFFTPKLFLGGGGVVIFAGGTGKPGVTTDSVTVQRAMEIGADAILKGTKVDGVYTKDPKKYKSAKKFNEISYNEYIKRKLCVMDLKAVKDARRARMPIVVFQWKRGALKREIEGKGSGSVINS